MYDHFMRYFQEGSFKRTCGECALQFPSVAYADTGLLVCIDAQGVPDDAELYYRHESNRACKEFRRNRRVRLVL